MPEAEFKEKHGVWDPAGVDFNLILQYVDSRVDSNTFTMDRVDRNPMSQSTSSPSQGLWIWPLKYYDLVNNSGMEELEDQ
jgi:hypothetical protein